jgi:L-malate glycosyltransferase
MNQNKNIVEQTIWDEKYQKQSFKAVEDSYFLMKWMNKYIPDSDGDCIEIGCYPGNFLPFFGKKGYTIHGIDRTPDVATGLPEWLKSLGLKVGSFQRISFEDYSKKGNFDIVCSFGFIEHFTNYLEVIEKHAELVKENGYLILEAPNMRGLLVRLLHILFYNEDYKLHYIKSMNPKKWKAILKAKGFEILDYGYIGGFAFFFENPKMNWLQRITAKPLKKALPYINHLLTFNSLFHSRCCVLIAKKTVSH